MTSEHHNARRIAILGAGELGMQALHYILAGAPQHSCDSIAGWIDDTKKPSTDIAGYPVIGNVADTAALFRDNAFDALFIAIGYNHPDFKLSLIEKFKAEIPMINIIAPHTYLDPSATLGCNVMLYPGAIIDKEAQIGDGVILNLGAIVSHNSTIGRCSFLAPRAVVAGFSQIGECSFMGAGSTVIDNISICPHTRLGAGAVAAADISRPGLYLGVPARLRK